MMYLFREVLDGRNERLADGVRRALGREPTDFTEFARRPRRPAPGTDSRSDDTAVVPGAEYPGTTARSWDYAESGSCPPGYANEALGE